MHDQPCMTSLLVSLPFPADKQPDLLAGAYRLKNNS